MICLDAAVQLLKDNVFKTKQARSEARENFENFFLAFFGIKNTVENTKKYFYFLEKETTDGFALFCDFRADLIHQMAMQSLLVYKKESVVAKGEKIDVTMLFTSCFGKTISHSTFSSADRFMKNGKEAPGAEGKASFSAKKKGLRQITNSYVEYFRFLAKNPNSFPTDFAKISTMLEYGFLTTKSKEGFEEIPHYLYLIGQLFQEEKSLHLANAKTPIFTFDLHESNAYKLLEHFYAGLDNAPDNDKLGAMKLYVIKMFERQEVKQLFFAYKLNMLEPDKTKELTLSKPKHLQIAQPEPKSELLQITQSEIAQFEIEPSPSPFASWHNTFLKIKHKWVHNEKERFLKNCEKFCEVCYADKVLAEKYKDDSGLFYKEIFNRVFNNPDADLKIYLFDNQEFSYLIEYFKQMIKLLSESTPKEQISIELHNYLESVVNFLLKKN